MKENKKKTSTMLVYQLMKAMRYLIPKKSNKKKKRKERIGKTKETVFRQDKYKMSEKSKNKIILSKKT